MGTNVGKKQHIHLTLKSEDVLLLFPRDDLFLTSSKTYLQLERNV